MTSQRHHALAAPLDDAVILSARASTGYESGIPVLDCIVEGPGYNPRAVGGVRHRIDGVAVTFEALGKFSSSGIPDVNGFAE